MPYLVFIKLKFVPRIHIHCRQDYNTLSRNNGFAIARSGFVLSGTTVTNNCIELDLHDYTSYRLASKIPISEGVVQRLLDFELASFHT